MGHMRQVTVPHPLSSNIHFATRKASKTAESKVLNRAATLATYANKETHSFLIGANDGPLSSFSLTGLYYLKKMIIVSLFSLFFFFSVCVCCTAPTFSSRLPTTSRLLITFRLFSLFPFLPCASHVNNDKLASQLWKSRHTA